MDRCSGHAGFTQEQHAGGDPSVGTGLRAKTAPKQPTLAAAPASVSAPGPDLCFPPRWLSTAITLTIPPGRVIARAGSDGAFQSLQIHVAGQSTTQIQYLQSYW